MREKRPRLIVTFRTTVAAITMERVCAARGVEGRLIPVPGALRAGCGMAWSAPPGEQDLVERTAAEAGIETEGFYIVDQIKW